MKKIRVLLAAALFTVFGASAFAADATVTFVSGKVEVQRNGKWIALQKGDTVAKSETISTGFQSEVKIKILDSVMYLGPVTRITLEELSSSGTKDNVNVYLKTGTARSQVNHVSNKRVDYQVHTAVAVASCRGTEWIIDDSNNVDCFEGVVAVAAYKPPVEQVESVEKETGDSSEDADSKDTKETKDTKDASEKTESSGKSESKDSTGTADAAGSGDAEKTPAAKTSTRPSSDEGVLVQANQSVKVSSNNSVSAPVKNVVKNANTIKSAVTSAAAKAAVGGDSSAPVEKQTSDSPMTEAARKDTKKETGTVIVKLEIPSEI